MFVVVYRINAIMHMNVTNLIIQIIIGALVYSVCIVLTNAPIIAQARKFIHK